MADQSAAELLKDGKADDRVDKTLDNGGGTGTQQPKVGFLRRIRSDPVYRMKVVDTVWIWLSFFIFGWAFSQLGPTLPDLQLLVNVDLETAAWLFTSSYFGYMVGCILYGILESRIHKVLLLFTAVFGTAIGTLLTPWCRVFWLMLAVRAVAGFFFGGIDTCSHSRLFALWKTDSGVWVQIMYLHFSTGGLLSPLAAEPFLAPIPEATPTGVPTVSPGTNVTGITYMYNTNGSNLITTPAICTNCTTPATVTVTAEDSNVQYAFLITGVIGILISLPLIISYCLIHRKLDQHADDGEAPAVRKSPSRFVFILAIAVMTGVFLLVTAWIESFANLLMSFCLYHVKWTKKQGSFATFLFWVAYAVGNFACVFLVQCFTTETLLLAFFTCGIVGTLGMTLASYFLYEPLIWLFVLTTGFAMSIMWPATFTWTEETVTPVTGKIASLFLVAGSFGLMGNPPMIAALMEEVHVMWYAYVHFIEAVILFLLFLFIVIVYRRVPEPEKPSDDKKPDAEMTLLSITEKESKDTT